MHTRRRAASGQRGGGPAPLYYNTMSISAQPLNMNFSQNIHFSALILLKKRYTVSAQAYAMHMHMKYTLKEKEKEVRN